VLPVQQVLPEPLAQQEQLDLQVLPVQQVLPEPPEQPAQQELQVQQE